MVTDTENLTDNVNIAIKSYKNHPSIAAISHFVTRKGNFRCQEDSRKYKTKVYEKVYEKCMFNEMAKYYDGIFSKYQCGFRKGFSSQHRLLVLKEKWKKIRDKGDSS